MSYSVIVEWKVPEGIIRCASMPRGKLVYDREQNVVCADVLDDSVSITFEGFAAEPQLKLPGRED